MTQDRVTGRPKRIERDPAEPTFHLAQVSLRIIQRVVAWYLGEQPSRLAARPATTEAERILRSKANSFLRDLGIIEGNFGKTRLTRRGTTLARALLHGGRDDVIAAWREIIEASTFCARLLRDGRPRGRMHSSAFEGRIMLLAEYDHAPRDVRTGAKALIRLLSETKYIKVQANSVRVLRLVKNQQTERGRETTPFLSPENVFALQETPSLLDTTRLARYCEEINDNYDRKNYFSVAFLCRAFLDHCPPIFHEDDFVSLAAHAPARDSTRHIAARLQESFRKQADFGIHKQIGIKEVQIHPQELLNLQADLNFLLSRIIEQLPEWRPLEPDRATAGRQTHSNTASAARQKP